jgi:hypothetical protein
MAETSKVIIVPHPLYKLIEEGDLVADILLAGLKMSTEHINEYIKSVQKDKNLTKE